jgi:hypothetical protein
MVMGQALKSLEGGCCVLRQGHSDLEGPMTWSAQENKGSLVWVALK